MPNRDDVLSDFTLEEEMSPAVLRAYLQRYPEHTKDLLELFNELTMSDLEATEASLLPETKPTNAEVLRVQHVQQSLFGSGARELAKELGLPRVFLIGLHSNYIYISSMPAAFLRNLAIKMNVRIQDVISGMQQADGQTFAMKSDAKPGVETPIEFQDYVEQAGLAGEEQRALQKLLASDGSD